MAEMNKYLAEQLGSHLPHLAQVSVWVGRPMSLKIALEWAAAGLGVAKHDMDWLEPDGETIKIGQVRPLYHRTHLSRDSSNANRAIIMEQAHRLSLPAQNALLKLLEEPPAGVYFLLGVGDVTDLTPTILSRAETVHLARLNQAEFNSLFQGQFNATELSRRFYLSGGDPLMAQNLDELSADMDLAKGFLVNPLGESFGLVLKKNPSRQDVNDWLEQLALLCRAGLSKAKSPEEIRAWLGRGRAILRTQDWLQTNVNHKLAFGWLLLGLKQ